jgi:hypothetical protein
MSDSPQTTRRAPTAARNRAGGRRGRELLLGPSTKLGAGSARSSRVRRSTSRPSSEGLGITAISFLNHLDIAVAMSSAASRSSSSETFGRTSSQIGSIIPLASSIPRGRGMNHTWKCAPPSPHR